MQLIRNYYRYNAQSTKYEVDPLIKMINIILFTVTTINGGLKVHCKRQHMYQEATDCFAAAVLIGTVTKHSYLVCSNYHLCDGKNGLNYMDRIL